MLSHSRFANIIFPLSIAQDRWWCWVSYSEHSEHSILWIVHGFRLSVLGNVKVKRLLSSLKYAWRICFIVCWLIVFMSNLLLSKNEYESVIELSIFRTFLEDEVLFIRIIFYLLPGKFAFYKRFFFQFYSLYFSFTIQQLKKLWDSNLLQCFCFLIYLHDCLFRILLNLLTSER